MQTRWCKHPQDAPQRPVPPPLPGDRGAGPLEQRVTASCPAPYSLPAAAGPTGHTGSPPDGSPSATAAHRPECAGLAQGLLGRLPAPHHFQPPLHLPQPCTRPAPARLSLLAHPPQVRSQTPTLLLTLARGRHPAPPNPPQPSPPTALRQTQRLLPRGAGPLPSPSRTLSICVSSPSGFPIKILQVLVFAGAEGTWTQVLHPRPTRGSLGSGAGRSLADGPLSCPHAAPTKSQPVSGWPVSIPLKPWAWGGGVS